MLAIGVYVELIESQQKSLTDKGRLLIIVTPSDGQIKPLDLKSSLYLQ
jgi:hypothetical protein